MRFSTISLSALLLASVLATPAFAQDEETAPPEPIKITGGVTLASDYRFRGFTQNGENTAIQGTINVTHESGLYVGTWASSINFAGNTEVDIYGGYSKEVVPGVTLDGGLLYYLYPKHGNYDTDFFEPYVNISGAVGPVTAKVGANYAWKQSAISDVFGNKASAIYLHGDVSTGIPDTPFGLNAHVGYAKSDSILGGPDGDVFDYSVGATATYKILTLGVAYVNTDVSTQRILGINPKEALGADGAVVFTLGAAF